jgi:LuxR family transcriptional regulator, maltose regulon positive regulatory protein
MQAAPARPVIVTKIRPPRRRRDILARPRLYQYLADNLDRKLILVSAPAGYGKTSLLVDFAQAAGLPVCWYRVETADADPPAFFEYLLASLAQRYPGVGERTRKMVNGDDKLDIEAVMGSLVNEIADGVAELFLLVLDDYHNLDDAVVVNAAMDLFLNYLPDNCRVILSTRTLPRKLTLTRLAGEGQVAGLGRDYLRFGHDEISALMRHIHGQVLTAQQCDELESLSQGWVAALVLAGGRLAQGAQIGRRAPRLEHGQLFDYLAQEVLARQSAARQGFLLRTSILGTLMPDLCDAVLGRSDSAAMLRALEEESLFLEPFDAEGTWYRYHPLFHEFLQSRLAVEPAVDVPALHRRAAAWHLATGLPEAAVDHLLGAGDMAAAAAEMAHQVNALAAGGRWRHIVRWVTALPEDVLRAWPVLLERLGVAQVQLGDIREGLESLSAAVTAFELRADNLGLANAHMQRGPALRLLGRLEEAEADSRQALDLTVQPRGVVAGEAHRNLGACHALRGDLAGARAELEAALACFETSDAATLAAHTHSDLAALYQLADNTEAALSHSEAARRHFEQVGNVGALAMALNNSAMALSAQGRFEAARAMLAEAVELTGTSGAMRTEALVRLGLGDVLCDLDRFADAVDEYPRGLALARQVGEMPLVVYGLAAWAEALRLAGRAGEGRALLAQGHEEIAPYHYAYESAYLAFVRGTLALDRAEFELAEDHLVTAGRALADIGARRDAARAALYRVVLADRRADQAGAATAWRQALDLLTALDCPESLAPTVRRLPEVRERLRGAPTRLRRALDLVTVSDPPAMSVTEPAGSTAAPPPALAVAALGPPEVRLAGKLVETSAWQTQVARDLFLYLVDRPAGATPLELMAAFWPDSPEARARGTLHSTVYRARAAAGKTWIVADGDRYRVPRQSGLRYDVAELEAHLAAAARAADDTVRAAALAAGLCLVRGPYLDGVSEEWCHARREMLEVAITDALVARAGACLRAGRAGEAAAAYRRVLERDPLREDAHRGLMRAYALAGDRGRALAQFERLQEVLRTELGARPDPASVALDQAIRAEADLPSE